MNPAVTTTGATRAAEPPIFARPSSRGPRSDRRTMAWASWVGWGALMSVLFAYGAAALAGITSFMGVGVAVLAVIATTPWLNRVARRAPRLELAGLFRISLAFKLVATLPRYLARDDSRDYYRVGRILSESFKSFHFLVDPGRSVPGTGTVRYLSGLVEVLTLNDEFATFVVFSLLGFGAIVVFVEAFMVAMPEVDPRRYALLVLFWPSLVYWPSSIGKDAVMLMGLSLMALGVGHLLQHRMRGLMWAAPGLITAGLVRPHVALIAVTAAICALVLRSQGRGVGSRLLRLSVILSLILGGAVASNAVESLFDIDGLNPTGLSAALDLANRRSTQGGSTFSAMRIDNPLDFPAGFVTVLFRPFPHEAASLAMLITSLEALVLAGLVVAAVPRVAAAMRYVRSDAYPVYAIVFTVVFVYLFSAMGNFGILARQRTMALPLVLALIALPTAKERVRLRRLAVST